MAKAKNRAFSDPRLTTARKLARLMAYRHCQLGDDAPSHPMDFFLSDIHFVSLASGRRRVDGDIDADTLEYYKREFVAFFFHRLRIEKILHQVNKG